MPATWWWSTPCASTRQRRTGEVLEVLGPPDRPCYRVRWEGGQESLFHPGVSGHIVHLARP